MPPLRPEGVVTHPPTHPAPANDKHTYDAARLVVTVQAIEPAAATVTVCRKGSTTETMVSCASRLDLNCNGLVGQDDPACRTFLSALTVRLPTPSKAVRRPPRGAAATPRPAPTLVRRPPPSLPGTAGAALPLGLQRFPLPPT